MAETICEAGMPVLPQMLQPKKSQLIQLLELFPNQKWRWDGISANPNITTEWITSHPDKPWCLLNLSCNPSLTMKFCLEFLIPKLNQLEKEDKKNRLPVWCWDYLSGNPGLKIAEILQLTSLDDAEKYKWNWKIISRRGDVTIEMLFPTIDSKDAAAAIDARKWDYEEASSNPNLTTEIVLCHPELWDWMKIATNSAVAPTKELITHPQYKLRLWGNLLSLHPLVSFPLMLEYAKSDKLDEFETYFQSAQCWSNLSRNRAVTIETILAYPNLPWDWEAVLKNPNLTATHIRQGLFIGKEIDAANFSAICSSHSNIPVEFILSEKEKYCNWTILSINPNLTAQLVLDNLANNSVANNTDNNTIGNLWNFDYLSYNLFRFNPNSLTAKEFEHHQLMDPAIWRALLSTENNSNSDNNNNGLNNFSRSSLPTALAELTLQYFSPFY